MKTNQISKYRAEHCNDKGYPKSNLETSEKLGIKETKQKIDNKECLISKTDKSNKLSCDSLDNYKSAIEKHTENDNIIDHKTVKSIENKLNDTLKILNGIFNVGSDTDRKNNEDRVHLASISTNVPPPPLDGLRKDHKPLKPGEEASGLESCVDRFMVRVLSPPPHSFEHALHSLHSAYRNLKMV